MHIEQVAYTIATAIHYTHGTPRENNGNTSNDVCKPIQNQNTGAVTTAQPQTNQGNNVTPAAAETQRAVNLHTTPHITLTPPHPSSMARMTCMPPSSPSLM
eukprot:scaffold31084_cov37-Cyclotella_meneghiniana.AAC.3